MEKISALMDNELNEHEAHQAMLRLKDTESARESWATYHLIGDIMRGEAIAVFDIAQRVEVTMDSEPTVLAPQRSNRTSRAFTYALSTAASISAIAVVGWMVFSTSNIANPRLEMARNASATAPLVGVEAQLISSPSDGQMNEYLLAHQGVSPSTSLHGVAPYIRTISTASAGGR